MRAPIPMTGEELAHLEGEVSIYRSLDKDAAEFALAEIRRCWQRIGELEERIRELQEGLA